LPGHHPDAFADVGPGGADRRQGLRPGRGKGIDEALVWDNLRMHLVAPLREFIEANTDSP